MNLTRSSLDNIISHLKLPISHNQYIHLDEYNTKLFKLQLWLEEYTLTP